MNESTSPDGPGRPGPAFGIPPDARLPHGGRAFRNEPIQSADSTVGPDEIAPGGGGAAPATETGSTRGPRRRRRRGGAGRKKASASATPQEPAARTEDGGAEPSNPERSRKKRSRRRRKKAGSSTAGESRTEDERPFEVSSEESREEALGGRGKKKRRRGSRGGRRRKKVSADDEFDDGAVTIESIPGEIDDELPLADLPDDAVLVEDDEGGRKPRRRTSSRKSKRSSRSEDDDGGGRSRRGSKKKRKSRSRRSDDDDDDDLEPETAAPGKPRHILVNASEPEETRVVVVEEGRIVDLQMTVKKQVSYVNDIYRGRVVNLEPAIGAAFIDFGQGRNGFLHASDVMPCYGDSDWSLDKLLSTQVEDEEWDPGDETADIDVVDEDKAEGGKKDGGRRRRDRSSVRRSQRVRLPIEKLLKKGQMVAAQITKDAIGDKGPTLTTYVSIPGRYLVLMPSLQRTGVSRKIDDEKERRRLKKILASLDIPEGMGVIVRTAGVGRTKADIKRDLEYLLLAWDEFSRRLVSGRNPAPLYQESDVAIRTMRDLFTPETEDVIVDSEEVFQRMVDFTNKLMPEHVDRIRRHEGARPLLHTNGVEQDFEKIFARRVELPSGGSIVIDQTEALVAIDVNSGRTREKGAEFEDIALKTNLEAAPEIARQIRLRDLGGIIVLDYIDMMRAGSRRAVERATRESLKLDRARSKIGRISQFGLLEMTRQRLGPGLSKLVYETCRRCRGSGRQRSASSRAQSILRRLGTALTLKGFTSVEVRAHPEVIEYLEKELPQELATLEENSGRSLVLLAVPDQVEDSVLHYLRADGREVRPGGRRKR